MNLHPQTHPPLREGQTEDNQEAGTSMLYTEIELK